MSKKNVKKEGSIATVSFEFERETKNCLRYQETENSLDVEQVMGTLYVRKECFGDEQPEKLIVSIKKL